MLVTPRYAAYNRMHKLVYLHVIDICLVRMFFNIVLPALPWLIRFLRFFKKISISIRLFTDVAAQSESLYHGLKPKIS